ncbi:MAG: putative ABC transporter permease [Bacillota bacterium]|nr:putative ABC transporter permease [Bacillota bacterium]
MNDILVPAFLFASGSCIGWGIELLFRRFVSKANPEHRWINPGFLIGPYLPLYGFGLCGMFAVALLCRQLISEITGSIVIEFIIVFIVMAVIMTIIEYFAGLIFIKHMHILLWDYSEQKLNLQGIICPLFSAIWGLLGCVYYYIINPYVLDSIYWLSNHLTFSFFIGAFFGVFGVDIAWSFKLSYKLRAFAGEKGILIKYEELKHHILQKQQALRQKRSFIMPFKTKGPILKYLESYNEAILQRNENALKRLKHENKEN